MAGPSMPSAPVVADPRFRVLARRYRPATFGALIGQQALVRTLTNAFQVGRIAHAYMLAGVRGVGKTTTARIIARALNCIGPDGSGSMTISPCGVCEHCVAIAEDRHLDVIEMDAASRTGVENMRELLDGVPYRPAIARFKVYIIDEVHMLSEKAFNALLKTLEEPPEHVKFVFATTEIRKVPVTVLSRCQRFDLRRVEAADLIGHLEHVANSEQVAVEPAALQLLARAADGSVRDSLSLLDQAIAHAGGTVDEQTVRDMLGLVDRTLCFDIFDSLMRGDAGTALDQLVEQYRAGADPLMVIEDLLELTHWVTRIKLAPQSALAPDVPEVDRVRGTDMAGRLSMAEVTRTWQMLLKGLSEIRLAPMPLHAAEMLLIRIAYAAELPTPAEALDALTGKVGPGDRPPSPGSGSEISAGSDAKIGADRPIGQGRTSMADRGSVPAALPAGGDIPPGPGARPGGRPTALSLAAAPSLAVPSSPPADVLSAMPAPTSFADVIDLARAHSEGILHAHLITGVHLVAFEPGRIELRLAEQAPADLPQSLSRFLLAATGVRWLVSLSRAAGEPTLRQQQDALVAKRLGEAAEHPLVRACLDAFPGAVLERIREAEPPPSANADDGSGESDE
ncbi:MAG: DNA polymerase III subunit gamma/tau [Rhodospirillales bacterium]|nr:DNA polymerase III subunit gamma/tau [Rhodospirillales bacterium]